MKILGRESESRGQGLSGPNGAGSYRVLLVNVGPQDGKTLAFELGQQDIACDRLEDFGKEVPDSDSDYDAIIVDLDSQHSTATRLVEQFARTQRETPVVALCSSLDSHATDQLLDLGVEDILLRPLDHGALATKVRWIAMRRQKERLSRRDECAAPEAACNNEPSPACPTPRELQPVDRSQLAIKLSQLNKVLPMSQSALDVFNMTTEGKSCAARIAAALCREPSLATEVLRFSNSSYYNRTGEKILDLELAVARLGQKRVGELALAASTLFQMTTDLLPWMDVELMWRRSIAAGIAMEILIGEGGHQHLEEGLFVSAIIHPLGRVVLASLYPDTYNAMIEVCERDNEALLRCERQVFPDSHAEIMSQILVSWNVPVELCQPLKHVLDDESQVAQLEEPLRTKVQLVKLAVFLGDIAVGRWQDWDWLEFPSELTLHQLRVPPVDAIIEETRQAADAVARFRAMPSDATAASKRSCDLGLGEASRWSYCSFSGHSFDFLAEILRSIGVELAPSGNPREEPRLLVNYIGTPGDQHCITEFANWGAVIVGDADTGREVGEGAITLALPAPLARLRGALADAPLTKAAGDDAPDAFVAVPEASSNELLARGSS